MTVGASALSAVLAGGGTAGHVEPALALADALRAALPEARITLLGTASGVETRLVPARGYQLATIPRVPLPRRLDPALLGLPVRCLAAVRVAGRVLDTVAADVLVGFGGYVALPAYLAARQRRVPFVVHEANARPGLANRLGARLTGFVAVAQPGTRLPHSAVTGLPLRAAVAGLDRAAARAAARAGFGLPPHRPVLLVFGGSQGARRLNSAAAGAAEAFVAAGAAVLHVTGPTQVDSVRGALPGGLGDAYRVLPYVTAMEAAYAAADLALCRAGAMTCAELAAVGLPAAYVPLPIGNGEQRYNALPTVAAGGGLLVADSDLTPDWLRDTVLPLLTDPGRLTAMGLAARRSA
ncbi:MAG: UDP-N-acetylglucosamine--N-acetylmuramyl-(pentapeptide) pyrophosphoryl-undecaprenol N-acetylglucosamine transferase, partial [Mycobacteriales bacterium]